MKHFINIVSDSTFQGFCALVGLIAAVLSDALWIRIPAILVLIGFVFALRSVIWQWMTEIGSWILALWELLNWRFLLGFFLGIIIALPLNPILNNVYQMVMFSAIPKVEVLDSNPSDGETLSRLHNSVEFRFSEVIPSKYLSNRFINVEISPDIPIEKTWIYNYDPEECCRRLSISPNKYYPNVNGPQFEPNTKYSIRLSGPLLKKDFETIFQTSSQ